jgi:hypothetical protein
MQAKDMTVDENNVNEHKSKPERAITAIAVAVCMAAAGVFLIGGANMWTAIAVVAMTMMGGGMSFLLLRARR